MSIVIIHCGSVMWFLNSLLIPKGNIQLIKLIDKIILTKTHEKITDDIQQSHLSSEWVGVIDTCSQMLSCPVRKLLDGSYAFFYPYPSAALRKNSAHECRSFLRHVRHLRGLVMGNLFAPASLSRKRLKNNANLKLLLKETKFAKKESWLHTWTVRTKKLLQRPLVRLHLIASQQLFLWKILDTH